MFSLICFWINGWVNNGEAGGLRLHRAHYDAILMISVYSYFNMTYRYTALLDLQMQFNKCDTNDLWPYISLQSHVPLIIYC